jgi:Zn-finger nucleic acid-binding protein
MRAVSRNGVEFDVCTACRGVWLDRGELEKLLEGSRAERAADDAERAAFTRERDDFYRDPDGYRRTRPLQDYGERGEHGERGDYGERGEYGHDSRGRKRRGFDLFDIFD